MRRKKRRKRSREMRKRKQNLSRAATIHECHKRTVLAHPISWGHTFPKHPPKV